MWTTISRLARRLSLLLRRNSVEAAMDDEMQYHIEREVAERVARGMSPADARRSAMLDFGGIDRHKEDARDVRGFRPLEDAARDAAYAVRVLRRNPGFTAAVVATFGLGIGCTCAIFSLMHGILLRPLPYTRPNELVALWERNVARGADRNVVSASNFEAWRERARSFSDVVAMVPAPRTLGGSPIERISAAQVSPAFFKLLGVRPAIGRDFSPADELNGGASVAILSDAMWRTRFGADPSIVGRSIDMDGQPVAVIGVMPADFEPPRFGWISEHPLWIPFAVAESNRNWGRFLHVIARRRAGVTTEEAAAEMTALGTRLSQETANNKGWSTTVVPLAEQITGDVRKPLVVLFAAVLLLLLMSAVNVANLVTTFTRRRHHELAVRRAIGATPFRLLRQQLAQTGLLGLVGTIVGLIVAVAATRALVLLMPPDVPRLAEVGVDGAVLAFGLVVAVSTTLIVGAVAALRGMGPRARSLDLASATRTTSRLGGSRIVAVEIAIGLVLSVLAALMVRSFTNLRAVKLGFQVESVVTARVSLPGNRYATPEQQRAFFASLLARTRAIPGVASASIATTRPFACCAPATTVHDLLNVGQSPSSSPTTDVRFVDDAYFSALRVPVLAGHAFTSGESSEGQPRAVVSRALARALWGDGNPIGRTVSMKLFGTTTAEVIAVVGDAHLADPRTSPRPALYLSTARFPSSERDVIVRGGDGATLLVALREALASVDPTVPLYRAASLEASVGVMLAQDRFTTALLGAFAVLSLILAGVGVYGVLSGDVTRRRKEIGIRLALGAKPSSVTALVLRRILVPASSGVAIGVVVALALSRSMSALVFGVGTSDPASFLTVIAVLMAVALVATSIPAIRATRVSPLEAIRID